MNKKVFRVILFLFIGLFFSLLIATRTGYYNNRVSKEKALTEEEIKAFEDDIKNNKMIDISKYTKNNYVYYNNNLSDNIYNVSLKLESVFNVSITKFFEGVSKLVSD